MDQVPVEPAMNQTNGQPEKKSVGPIIGIVVIIIIIILGALFIYGGSVRRSTEPPSDASVAESEAMELQNISAQNSSDETGAILQDLEAITPENLGDGLENL